VSHRFFKAFEAELKHGEDVLDKTDGVCVRPGSLQNRVNPGSMGEDLGNKLEPLVTGPADLSST